MSSQLESDMATTANTHQQETDNQAEIEVTRPALRETTQHSPMSPVAAPTAPIAHIGHQSDAYNLLTERPE
jgi:hypothetical protein